MIKMTLALCFFFASTVAAADTTYKITGGTAGFTAIGKPGFLRINGEGGKPTGELVLAGDQKLVRLEVRVALSDLLTGLDLRDKHMKEKYLEVSKYPDASFKAENVALEHGQPASDTLPGTLTLHGVSKQVNAKISGKTADKLVSGEADLELEISQFGIEIPSFAGVTVAETVKVHITYEATAP